MEDVNFQIINYSLDGNSIIVRPYSTQFKYASSFYNPVNINFTNLDPNIDLNIQIAAFIQPLIDSILKNESDVSHFQPLLSALTLDTISTVPLTDVINHITSPQPLSNGLIPLSGIQDQANSVVSYKLQETYNNMLSSTLFDGIEFLV
jgi:hypothetical protein